MSTFREYLIGRRSAGDSLALIGRDLGVSRQAVDQWLRGVSEPSRTVLILAAILAGRTAGEWPLEDLSGTARRDVYDVPPPAIGPNGKEPH